MGSVILEEMEFFAFHGYYEEEQKIGNKYTVSLKVETNFAHAAKNDDLEGTINYEGIYAIVKQVMSEPSKLLEHLGQKIIVQIMEEYGNHTKVEVSISKYNPPVGGVCAKSTVIMTEQDLG
ncbi:MAG: dihydroneopterin aldolase [Bacteroidota bacterium]